MTRSSSSGGQLLVAIIPNLLEPGGRVLLEEARRLEERGRLGRCVFIEADMDALALVDEARRLGAEGLLLVGASHSCPGPAGEPVRVEPLNAERMDPRGLVKELWMNLTGSLGLDDYVAALRILYGKGFWVLCCTGPRECGEAVRAAERLCLEGEESGGNRGG